LIASFAMQKLSNLNEILFANFCFYFLGYWESHSESLSLWLQLEVFPLFSYSTFKVSGVTLDLIFILSWFLYKVRDPYHFWVYTPKNKNQRYYRDSCIPMLVVALLTITKLWNQLTYPLMDEWLKKMLYKIEFYLVNKKNELCHLLENGWNWRSSC
jgi:hypothetical protein